MRYLLNILLLEFREFVIASVNTTGLKIFVALPANANIGSQMGILLVQKHMNN